MKEEDFWAVWKAAEQWFPAGLPDAFLHGMTGGLLRSRRSPLFYSDLTHWLQPGLPACGVQAESIVLPLEEADGLTLLRRHTQQNRPVPVFTFAELQGYAEPTDDADEANTRTPVDAALTGQGIVLSMDVAWKTVTVEDSSGQARAWAWEAFRANFTQ